MSTTQLWCSRDTTTFSRQAFDICHAIVGAGPREEDEGGMEHQLFIAPKCKRDGPRELFEQRKSANVETSQWIAKRTKVWEYREHCYAALLYDKMGAITRAGPELQGGVGTSLIIPLAKLSNLTLRTARPRKRVQLSSTQRSDVGWSHMAALRARFWADAWTKLSMTPASKGRPGSPPPSP